MDTTKAQLLVDQLEDNVDDLEETLQPIISQALSESTKKLPLLDKAKLHIVIVYAIESLLFSYLRLHNVDAKEHPVFRELTRVKQYFEKVKTAEDDPVQPRENLSLNKQAAARIIKHSLAGNDKFDLARLEREAREKLLAKRKLKDLEANMKDKAQTPEDEPKTTEQRLVDQIAAEIEQAESIALPETPVSEEQEPKPARKDKKRKRKEVEDTTNGQPKSRLEEAKAAKKARKKAKKEAKLAEQVS